MEGSTKLRARCTGICTQSDWRAALLLVASFLGCGGLVGPSPSQPPPTDIAVSISPQTAAVELGASRIFSAKVSSAGDPSVNWILSGGGCAGSACGTVDPSGTYTAPQILTAPPSISLTAASVADPSKRATATITVTSSFSVAIAGPASVTAGDHATYAVTLTGPAGSNPSSVISWSVAGAGCTGAACGTISASGVFTAPSVTPSPATVQIMAEPQADPSKATSVSVSILPMISVSISPSAATMALGAAQAFQATVVGAQDATVTWDVNGVVGGNAAVGLILNSQTAPNATTYTAPQTLPANGAVTVHARSNADPSISANATVGFTTASYVTLMPANATLAIGERKTFTAAVNNTANQNVVWLVNRIPGGNSAVGQVCVSGSDPCQAVSTSVAGSVDYIAPAGLPSPNPVTITAASQAAGAQSASASVTILPHIVVSVLPQDPSVPGTGQARFTASVLGTDNQLVIWSIAGAGCGVPLSCGSIDSSGLYTAPPAAPTSDPIIVVATSSEDTNQSGTATVTITTGPAIFSLSPTSAYANTAGGFTLLVSGYGFGPDNPGPASTILVNGNVRGTSCASVAQCITTLAATDLQSPGSLSVQVVNDDGSLSNTQMFVVQAPGAGAAAVSLTPSAPTSAGNDIVVVELSSNGGSGVPGNVSLNIGAIGTFSLANLSCVLSGNPVVIVRPAQGVGTGDICVFSVSALDPLFTFTVSGPSTPDITVSNSERLGLGLVHLTLQVPATAAPGSRTLFIENSDGDKAAGTGAIEVQ